ncbi:MAG: mannose-6-phosphate isomerase, class I [Lachnospiraceae bacterium]|nr:mannose-6-phosphate isomerase, class I [Lachnospiraceae bacterium]
MCSEERKKSRPGCPTREGQSREVCLNGDQGKKEGKEILFFNPVFTHNIWGGRRLKETFGYSVMGDDIGECWGIAAHPNGDCTVREGKFAGKKLSELWREERQLFGNIQGDSFPLLVKMIDAKEDLSIQVHPNNKYADIYEETALGKTECWYIMDCPKETSLIIGHHAKTKKELSDMIQQGRWRELLREVPVKKGDFIQIDPGTIHAIKGGMMILEIQQNSDITYRIYDYGRLNNGKPRELHIKKGIEVITVPSKSMENSMFRTDYVKKNRLTLLYSCEFYQVFKLNINGTASFEQKYPFFLMSVLKGEGSLNEHFIKAGDHLILPAEFGKVKIQGKMQVICSCMPIQAQT